MKDYSRSQLPPVDIVPGCVDLIIIALVAIDILLVCTLLALAVPK